MRATQDLTIRPLLTTEAADVLDTVFERLSEESRRRRFLMPMPRLPGFARRQLSDVDDWSHVALAAWAGDEPIALGRFVWLSAEDVEVAIEVIDAWQGRGVGGQLLDELTARARALGYRRLIADVLPENTAMLELLRRVFPDAAVSRRNGLIHVTCPIATASAGSGGGAVPAQRAAAVAGAC